VVVMKLFRQERGRDKFIEAFLSLRYIGLLRFGVGGEDAVFLEEATVDEHVRPFTGDVIVEHGVRVVGVGAGGDD
jgi:hypothetical protein